MKTINRILALTFLCFAAFDAKAQQDPMISQYMTNQLFFNPAYAGSHDYTTVSGLYRKQWVDFPGAPVTGFISFDKKFVDRNVGLGFTLVNDKIGITDQTDVGASYAYHIPMAKGRLSLGLKGTLSHYNAMVTDLTIWDQNDQVFLNNINGKWMPNFGAGAYYYTDRFYAGLSVPHLLNYNKPSSFISARLSSVPNYERHYFLTSGYVIGFQSDVYMKPSILVKYLPNAPIEADLNMNVFFMNMFSVGLSYRTNNGMVSMMEIKAARRLRIGYAFDWQFNDMRSYTNGTHEIMLAYDFIQDIIKMRSPRFF